MSKLKDRNIISAIDKGFEAGKKEARQEIIDEIEKMGEGLDTYNPEGVSCNPRCHDSGKAQVLSDIKARLFNNKKEDE